MKKLFILILAAVMATPSFAQFGTSRSRYNHNDTESYYGLRLGLNIASISSSTTEMDMDSRTGLAFGAVYGFQLVNSAPVWLETGLFYSEKGGRFDNLAYIEDKNGVQSTKYQEVTTRLGYFEVPVVVKYAFDLMDDFYVEPFLGGYLALGVGGKTKYYQQEISDSSFDKLSRFDGGLRVGCGIEYQMLYAEVGFDFGIANIGKDDFKSVHNRNLFINVGVNF